MFGSFGTQGACTSQGRTVDKVVLIAMVAQVAETNAKLCYAANTIFVCNVVVWSRCRVNSAQ